jgi:lysophospholipase L1-like esterase
MPEPGTQEDIVIPSDGVMTKDMFVRLKDSWLTDGSSNIVIGNDKGYHMCYLPVDVSGYSSISVTANDDHNAYFQFFKDDNLNGLCGTRIIVEKGKTMVFEIPSGAKYLVMSHSRTNLTDVADGYGLYFPAALRIFKTTAEASTGPWAGKKMVVMGDSITAVSYHNGDSPAWYQTLAEEIGIGTAYGSGVSGSAISTTSYYGTNYQPMVLRYEKLPSDGDLYIVFGGTNDYTLSTPLGTINDVTDVSFYGALDVLINGLKNKVPEATIVFMTPLNRYGYGQTRVKKIKLITPYTLNDEGHNLFDYRKAIIDKCTQHSIPVIDIFTFPEFNFSQGQDGVSTFNSSATYAHPWTNDGLHPNHLGQPALGKVLVPYINRIWIDAAFPGSNEDINNSEGEW